MGTADVMIHVDEALGPDERASIVASLKARGGVAEATSNPEKPHLLLVKYEPKRVSAETLLQIAREAGVHAELIGL